MQISFSFSFYSILKFLLSSFSSQLLVWLGRGYSAYSVHRTCIDDENSNKLLYFIGTCVSLPVSSREWRATR